MATPIYDQAAPAAGFAPLPKHACWKCSNGTAPMCTPCASEIAHRLRSDDDELSVIYFDRNTRALHQYPADIRMRAL